MARKLQRNEETTLKDRMEMVCIFRHDHMFRYLMFPSMIKPHVFDSGTQSMVCGINACAQTWHSTSCCFLQLKRNHAGLSDQLLRIVRALDALEGRFAEQSHHHNSKTHQIHEALSQDLAQLETVLAPTSAGEWYCLMFHQPNMHLLTMHSVFLFMLPVITKMLPYSSPCSVQVAPDKTSTKVMLAYHDYMMLTVQAH